MSRKSVLCLGFLVLVFASLTLVVPGRPFAQEIQENQIKRAKIFDEPTR